MQLGGQGVSGIMAKPDPVPCIALQTLRCMSVIPSKHRMSSRDVGWRSLLLDIHSGVASHDPYDSVATPDPRIGVTLSGRFSADFHSGGRWRHDAHAPGSINLHRTGDQTRYRFPRPQDADFRLALVYYPLSQLEAAADHLRRPGQSAAVPAFGSQVVRDPALTEVTLNLVRAMEQGADDFYAETVAAWLAVHMVTRHGDAAQDGPRRAEPLSDQRLTRVIDYMSAHFAEPVTLERLAAEACISKFHFNRLFARKMGTTPYRYLTRLRLHAAQEMLVTTVLPIARIAAACGFLNPSHFSAAFTKEFGMPATTFRADHQRL